MELIKDAGKSRHGKRLGLYKCHCGTEKVLEQYRVNNGTTKSCGCIQGEKHGDSHTRLYNIWSGMKARCNNNKHTQYKDYGGRGIKLCDEWKNSYTSFKQWATSNGYTDELTIDRIDVNGDYAQSNCRWVNHKVQNNNTRTNHYIEDGVTLTEKCEELGVDPKLVSARINTQGMTFEEAIEKPKNFNHMKIMYDNKEYNLKELCFLFGLNYSTVHKRLTKYGWELTKAIENDACEWILNNQRIKND